MPLPLSKFRSNPVKSEEGVWIEYPEEGFALKIARMGNAKYTQEIVSMRRGKQIASPLVEEISPSAVEAIQMKAMAKHILLDWRGITDDNGEEIPFSPEKAYEIISDPQYRDFYTLVQTLAADAKNFLDEAEGVDEGN